MKREGRILNLIIVLFLVVSLFSAFLFHPTGASQQGPRSEVLSEHHHITRKDLDKARDSEIDHTYNISSDSISRQVTEVDILIAYTSRAKEWAVTNEGGIEEPITTAESNANTAMENSEIDLDVKVVQSFEVDYSETGDDLGTDLRRLQMPSDGHMDEVYDIRDYYGADLVSLLVKRDESSNVLGIANGPTDESELQPMAGFSVVSVQDISSRYVFSHEIGHNFGAGHNRDLSEEHNPGPQMDGKPYSAGWKWSGDKQMYEYVSVMSYPESGFWGDDERVLHFSNPEVYHKGDPTGKRGEANNARTISETKDIVSDYQEPTPQIEILTPSGGEEWYEGTEQEIVWETVSGRNGIDGVDISYSTDGGTTWTTVAEGVSDTGNYTWEVPLETTSEALISVRATDDAGYSREDTTDNHFQILEDSHSPSIEIEEPTNGEAFEEMENVTVSWTGNDDYSGIDYYEVKLNDNGWESIGDETQHTFRELDEGEYTVTVRAVDRAGNIEEAEVQFSIEGSFLSLIQGDTLYTGILLFSILILVIAVMAGSAVWRRKKKTRQRPVYQSYQGTSPQPPRSDRGEGLGGRSMRAPPPPPPKEQPPPPPPPPPPKEEDIWCPCCGYRNSADNRYCIRCRTRLEDADMGIWGGVKCPNCGSQNLEVHNYCIHCGSELQENPVEDESEKKLECPYCNHMNPQNVISCELCGYDLSSYKEDDIPPPPEELAECAVCGAMIPSRASSCPNCGVQFSSSTVKCSDCGAWIDSDAKRCPECGAEFGQ